MAMDNEAFEFPDEKEAKAGGKVESKEEDFDLEIDRKSTRLNSSHT